MPRPLCWKWLSRTWFPAPVIALASITPAALDAADPIKLNLSLTNGGDVTSVEFSPDGSRVLYLADQDNDEVFEIYSVPSAGGSVVKLNGALTAGGDVSVPRFSPDSSRVLYLADQDNDNVFEIFSVPSNGGASVKLNGSLVAGGDVDSIDLQFSANSQRVIYRADQATDTVIELYSVPSAGGTPVKLNSTLPAGADVFHFHTSPDSSRVVYRANQDSLGENELFSVPIGGGTPVQLNGPLVAGGDVNHDLTGFEIQSLPDSSRVIYLADEDTDEKFELYSVPTAGGASVKLNFALPSFGDVSPYAIGVSPDSSRVVYQTTPASGGAYGLYSVPSAGGASVQLNDTLVAGGELQLFGVQFSPDSSRVTYYADQDTDEVFELYSVATTGGTPVKLNGPLVAGGDVITDFETTVFFSPDSSRVIYAADQETDGVVELYSVPSAGGPSVKLNSTLVAGGDVLAAAYVNPDSSRVMYFADQEVNDVTEIFIVPIEGGTPVKVSGPMVVGGNVLVASLGTLTVPEFSSDGSKILYQADQDTDGVIEAYVRIVRQRTTGGGNWDSPGAWDQGVAPDSVMQVYIDPFSAVTLTGPGLRTVNELTIDGAGASLKVLSDADLQAINGLVIRDDGELINTEVTGRSIVHMGTDAPLAAGDGGTLHIGADGRLTLDGGEVTTTHFIRTVGGQFDFRGGVFELSKGDGAYNASYAFGGEQGDAPEFRITDGADMAVTFSWNIASGAGEYAETVVSGVDGGRRSTLRGTNGGGGADLIVGGNGTGQLTVSSGGLADLRDDFILGNGSTGHGTALVTGVLGGFRSTIEANNAGAGSVVQVGLSGFGNLTIANGGLVTTSGNAQVGQNLNATGIVTIGGASGGFDATLDVAGDLSVGGSTGGVGDVTVNPQGLLQAGGTLRIYQQGEVEVNGGSAVVDTIDLQDGTLTISSGNVLTSNMTVPAGGILTHDGGTLEINAGDATFDSTLSVGSSLSFPLLAIADGADAAVGSSVRVGNALNDNGVVDVSGFSGPRRSTLRTTGGGEGADVIVGRDGSGAIGVSNGGLVAPQDDVLIGNGASGFGSVLVSELGGGFRSTLEASGNGAGSAVRVGVAGVGELQVFNGALANTTGDFTIGETTGSSGTVSVFGASGGFDATIDVADDLAIGGTTTAAGGAGVLTVRNGGRVEVGDRLTIWEGGTLNLDGGDIVTDALDNNHDGEFNFLAGSLTITSMVSIGGSTAFPENLTLGAHQTLVSPVFTSIPANRSLTLSGGTLVTNTLAVTGSLQFLSGTLELTGGGVSGLSSFLVPTGGTLRATSIHAIPVSAAAGSAIEASGSLTLGDFNDLSGFYSNGAVRVNDFTVTLRDKNEVVFDSGAHVELGDSGSGELIASNGLTLDFGGNLSGHGTVSTPDDPATPLINNGAITGNSIAERISLTGYVKGVGVLDNVIITGTDAPGFSPATVNRGSVSYQGTLEIEIGGASGGDYDRVNHILGAGVAELGGTLSVQLIDDFVPSLGAAFEILSAVGGIVGVFDNETLPGPGYEVLYSPTTVVLVATSALAGDYNNDGAVDAADYTVWRDNVGAPAGTLLNDTDGGAIDTDQYSTWRANYGATIPAPGLLAEAAVPEPTAVVILSLCGAIHFLRRRGPARPA